MDRRQQPIENQENFAILPEVKRMIEELLSKEHFQKSLNEASLNIHVPDDFNTLKAFIPEGKPFTIEYVELAVKGYRAHIIVETRKFLTEITEKKNEKA